MRGGDEDDVAAAVLCDDILLRGVSFIGPCPVNIKKSWEIYF
jgi:hypothetical protein